MSDYCCRVFYKYFYNTSNYFLSADKVKILLSITALSLTNSLYLIFESVINSVSISQSVAQSLIFSSVILFFTINLFINLLL
ncbi:hypothetical protein EMPG_10752 [Blastomyces silverae]|uniref:Uncharacterized protein n=1 Tax=Blastomyces silverae TaxID=2060906 RepID=A0A0H1B9D3_9EURO|nr:hypothetical protein EMPG_10752 [Blastomyces silverae]